MHVGKKRVIIFLFLPVATPVVTITRDPTGTLYVRGNVTLECLIRLGNTVDTSVMVTVVWSASDGVAITKSLYSLTCDWLLPYI